MQSNITLKSTWRSLKFSAVTVLLLSFFLGTTSAQTTIVATQTLTTVASTITFNFTNNNATTVVITNISAPVNFLTPTPVSVEGYVKNSAIAGPPGPITPANGWNQFATATITSATPANSVQSFFNCSIAVPAGATYGITLNGSSAAGTASARIIFNNGTGTSFTPTFSAGGATLTTGPNVSYNTFLPATPPNPIGAPSYFIGSITFVAATPCSGTPAPGNTVSTASTVCPGTPFTLSAASNPPAGTTGLTYQWQSSPTVGGTFTDIPGANSSTYTTTVSNLAYRVIVTCSGNSGTSTPVFVATTPQSGCYCIPPATNCSLSDAITNVNIGGINNTSTCSAGPPTGYGNFTALTPGVLLIGASNPSSVTVSNGGTEFVAVWIDYNQNGIFEATEFQALGTGPGGTFTTPINVPASALTGTTRMRVRVRYNTALTANDACLGYGFGETEDYRVTLRACVPVSITGQPANTSATCGNNATFTVTTTGDFPAYQWQYRVNATSPWITITNTPPYTGANSATLTITGVAAAMSGYQYRVIISGACTGADFSSPATLTVTSLIPVVNPASASICLGSTQQISITNIASPTPGSVTVNSTFPTPIVIPDNPTGPFPVTGAILAGINTSLAVTVPAGAIVTGVSVRVSGTHTYVGDLVMSLKAPNNNVVNLDYFLNQTGGGVSTAYNNLVITSNTSAPALSTATAAGLYTGTYRADLVGAAGTAPFSNSPGGATGFLPTGTSFTPLFTPTTAANATGNWTLAIYDGGPGDIGTLRNWSITVNYILGSPATGIYTGPTGTIFTDAAATIDYTGTPINTVYVKPTTVGLSNYTVVVTDGPCTSSPLTIPVTVNSAAVGSPTLGDTSVCAGFNTFLKLRGTLTGGPGLVHNFQVKATGAANFVNITAGGVYSISGDTLKLTNVPISLNGYQFRDSISSGSNCGSVISTVATLTVNPIPVVTISAAPRVNLFPGLTTTLTAAVSSANPPITYQWFRNGVAVAGATNNTLVVDINGTGSYTVVVTGKGCSSTAATTTGSPIVIGDSTGVNTLFIYPSPNTGKFQVRYFFNTASATQLPTVVNVYDQKGARVFTRRYVGAGFQAMNVDLSAHGKGIYRVELIADNGDRIKTGSVMVF